MLDRNFPSGCLADTLCMCDEVCKRMFWALLPMFLRLLLAPFNTQTPSKRSICAPRICKHVHTSDNVFTSKRSQPAHWRPDDTTRSHRRRRLSAHQRLMSSARQPKKRRCSRVSLCDTANSLMSCTTWSTPPHPPPKQQPASNRSEMDVEN